MPSRYKCVVNGCVGRDYTNITRYRFPKDPKLKLKWCENLNIDIKKINTASKVCCRHFDAGVIQQRILKKNSVPTVDLGPEGKVIHTSIIAQKRRRICDVFNCGETKLRLHVLPQEEPLKSLWLSKLDIRCKKRYIYICSQHFAKSDKQGRKLKPNAVPINGIKVKVEDSDSRLCEDPPLAQEQQNEPEKQEKLHKKRQYEHCQKEQPQDPLLLPEQLKQEYIDPNYQDQELISAQLKQKDEEGEHQNQNQQMSQKLSIKGVRKPEQKVFPSKAKQQEKKERKQQEQKLLSVQLKQQEDGKRKLLEQTQQMSQKLSLQNVQQSEDKLFLTKSKQQKDEKQKPQEQKQQTSQKLSPQPVQKQGEKLFHTQLKQRKDEKQKHEKQKQQMQTSIQCLQPQKEKDKYEKITFIRRLQDRTCNYKSEKNHFSCDNCELRLKNEVHLLKWIQLLNKKNNLLQEQVAHLKKEVAKNKKNTTKIDDGTKACIT